MNFSFTEEQNELRALAREILEKELPLERIKEVEASPDRIDVALWRTLGAANLLGVAVPEAQGGMGMGLLELGVLLEELGRCVAPVPALASLVGFGLPVARFGSEEQRERWLRPLASGEAPLTAALVDRDPNEPARPATRARRDGSRWVLGGTKRMVPAAAGAVRVLVPAATDAGVGLFLVDPSASGVELRSARVTSRQRHFDLELSGARVEADDLLGGTIHAGSAEWLHDCVLTGACLLQVGISERAIEITTDHLRQREQFGAPIGTFPAVQHRAADAFMDLAAMRWTAWRAAWKLAEGLPASREAAVAKFWAAEGGARIASACQHLHGGLGVDVDYPIHRYFLWSKALELHLGSATPQLRRLGRDMARTGPQELA